MLCTEIIVVNPENSETRSCLQYSPVDMERLRYNVSQALYPGVSHDTMVAPPYHQWAFVTPKGITGKMQS